MNELLYHQVLKLHAVTEGFRPILMTSSAEIRAADVKFENSGTDCTFTKASKFAPPLY